MLRRQNGSACFAAYNRQLTQVLTRLDQAEEDIAAHERQWRLVTGQNDTGELGRRAVYLDILANMFNDDELKTLCFNLGANYEALPASGTFGKARELMLWGERHNKLERLYESVRKARPFLFDED